MAGKTTGLKLCDLLVTQGPYLSAFRDKGLIIYSSVYLLTYCSYVTLQVVEGWYWMLHDVLVGKTKHQTATPRRAARQTLRDMTTHTVSIAELQLHSPEDASQTTTRCLSVSWCLCPRNN